ncbi:MAG: hypothetical protein HY276_06155 [Ignavibacteriales bacterium]|nr:hypothetical protein [Ignavibacteriales bacterium]MBI3787826.1 hypothetical protein [Ignavibacteriales bacterium]
MGKIQICWVSRNGLDLVGSGYPVLRGRPDPYKAEPMGRGQPLAERITVT